jgi:3-oxoadipate enol-lactonase
MNEQPTPQALTATPDSCVGAATRPTLIFLHGIGGRAHGWAPVMDACAHAGWPCLAWDMPGYGDSPWIHPYDFDGLSDALHALLLAHGLGQAVLVGHSMGGMVALQHWARHCADVKALVLVASSPAFGNGSGDFQREFVAQRLAPLEAGRTLADVAERIVPSMLAPGASATAHAAAKACMGSIATETYRASIHALVTFEQRAALPSITVPTLCVAAELDRTASPSVVQRMAEKIPGASCVVMPGVNHLLTFEQPDAFARVVLDFVERSVK